MQQAQVRSVVLGLEPLSKSLLKPIAKLPWMQHAVGPHLAPPKFLFKIMSKGESKAEGDSSLFTVLPA